MVICKIIKHSSCIERRYAINNKVLISFVGNNDFNEERSGAILTVAENIEFGEIHLLWCRSKFTDYNMIGKYVKSEIERKELSEKVVLEEIEIEDPTNHNEIYPKLMKYLKSIHRKNRKFFAAISSGTPSMQACWILIAESNAFPIKLFRSDDPKWGVDVVRPVKLSTALPKIVILENENLQLKKLALKKLCIDRKIPEVKIGDKKLELSPIEFVYYTFFAERALEDKEYLKFGTYNVPAEFFDRILKMHEDMFESADIARDKLRKTGEISCSTFRTNVTRINKKIEKLLGKKVPFKYYLIESEGMKFAKRYGMNLPGELIEII